MNTLLRFLLSVVIVIDLYLAEHSIDRPEIFYGAAAVILFAALAMVAHLG